MVPPELLESARARLTKLTGLELVVLDYMGDQFRLARKESDGALRGLFDSKMMTSMALHEAMIFADTMIYHTLGKDDYERRLGHDTRGA